jgi:hypothetical protein
MSENWEKFIQSIILILIGAFLGQANGLFQEWRNNRRLKKSLINELEYLHDNLIEFQMTYEASLKIYSQKSIDSTLPSKIAHPIYSNHYKDVCHKLNKYQRQSYDLIHGLIEKLNSRIDEQSEITETLYRDYLKQGNLNEEFFGWWGEIIASQYLNAITLEWCVNYHLHNQSKPFWDYGSEQHKNFLEFLEERNNKVDMIIKEGKNEDLTNLNKTIIEKGSMIHNRRKFMR